ncbi:hypothetical protein [Agrobacterium sp. T29]|uniref:hypothetical protein n=1 Tax=Agrobacterium sp. T29 TaxID=2580515 RepID=UPI00143DBFA3|nr:hypothetical protein [Agrobacterium sp. T29]
MGGLPRRIGTTEDKPGERATASARICPKAPATNTTQTMPASAMLAAHDPAQGFLPCPDRLRHDGDGDDFQPCSRPVPTGLRWRQRPWRRKRGEWRMAG